MDIQDLTKMRVGVLGFGQEGRAVTVYLLRHGISPVLFDKRPGEKFTEEQQKYITSNKLKHFFGNGYLENLNAVDVVFRSPGIWRLTPELLAAEKNGLVITSQVKWFFEHCPASVIGITGTKGKGTTSSLIYHILTQDKDKRKVFLTGNIGQIQPLDFLNELKPADQVVYELSSFQLQDLGASPHIAVVLMVTADHLDAHTDVKEYHRAKQSIVKFQRPNDFAIINYDYDTSRTFGEQGSGRKLYFSRVNRLEGGAFVESNEVIVNSPILSKETLRFNLSNINLRGLHNLENVSAAILASLAAGTDAKTIQQTLPSFEALPHRLQRLPDQAGIQFYNDSYSTTPDTAEAAVKSFFEPIILILGGSDKNADFTALSQAISAGKNVKAVAAIGVTGPVIAEKLKQQGYKGQVLQNFRDLDQVMRTIKQIAKPGDVVLLSPATASFDWYSSYTERGKHFAELAGQWSKL
jgi:UDP-N-acetylmuramoylalanine--D-glutamate ligase